MYVNYRCRYIQIKLRGKKDSVSLDLSARPDWSEEQVNQYWIIKSLNEAQKPHFHGQNLKVSEEIALLIP